MRPPARRATTSPLRALQGYRQRALALLLCLACCGVVRSERLSVHLQTADGRPLRGAVVQVQSVDTPARHAAPVHAVMDQIDRAFQPDLLIIPVGSSIIFPNTDTTAHQIYSFSPAKQFQLPLYHGQPYPPTQFDQAGIVTLGCNIHDQMLAYVVVTSAPYFGRTDAQGVWSADVSEGRYRVAIWHPRLRDDVAALERDITVAATDPAELTVRLKKALTPAPLTDRPFSWEY